MDWRYARHITKKTAFPNQESGLNPPYRKSGCTYASIRNSSAARRICSSDKGIMNKRFRVLRNRLVFFSFFLQIVMCIISSISCLFMALLIPDSNRVTKFPLLLLPLENYCCEGHNFF